MQNCVSVSAIAHTSRMGAMDRREALRGLSAGTVLAGLHTALPAASEAKADGGKFLQQGVPLPTEHTATSSPLLLPQLSARELPKEKSTLKDDYARNELRALDGWDDTKKSFRTMYAEYLDADAQQPVGGKKAVGRSRPELEIAKPPLWGAEGIAIQSTQVEFLVDQVLLLTDRAAATKSVILDRAVQAASIANEIAEFYESDEIHGREIAQGIYRKEFDIAELEWQAAKLRRLGQEAFLATLKTMTAEYYDADHKKVNEASGASQLLAWMSGPPTASQNYTWNKETKHPALHARDAAAILSFRKEFVDYYTRTAERQLQDSLFESLKLIEEIALKRKEWARADIDFKRERVESARQVAAHKIRLATEDGGAYNFASQVDQLRLRMHRDLLEASVRARGAAQGLKDLFGLSAELPLSVRQLLEHRARKVDLLWVVEDLGEWARRVVAFLNSFRQTDMASVVTVSLKQRLSEVVKRKLNPREFYKVVKAPDGSDIYQWTFELTNAKPDSTFHGLANVRIRGMNLYITGNRRGMVAKGTITVPKVGTVIHKGGSDPTQFGQATLPPIRIGRITSRGDRPYPELFGTVSHRNASPHGTWIVELAAASLLESGVLAPSLDPRNMDDDVELDIEYVAQAI